MAKSEALPELRELQEGERALRGLLVSNLIGTLEQRTASGDGIRCYVGKTSGPTIPDRTALAVYIYAEKGALDVTFQEFSPWTYQRINGERRLYLETFAALYESNLSLIQVAKLESVLSYENQTVQRIPLNTYQAICTEPGRLPRILDD